MIDPVNTGASQSATAQLATQSRPGFPNWLSQVGDDGNRMRFPRRLRQ